MTSWQRRSISGFARWTEAKSRSWDCAPDDMDEAEPPQANQHGRAARSARHGPDVFFNMVGTHVSIAPAIIMGSGIHDVQRPRVYPRVDERYESTRTDWVDRFVIESRATDGTFHHNLQGCGESCGVNAVVLPWLR